MELSLSQGQERLLRLCLCLLFWGRAWPAIFFDLPLWSLVGQHSLFWAEILDTSLALSWLLAGAWFAFAPLRPSPWQLLLLPAWLGLVLVIGAQFLDKHWAWAEWIEHGLQLGLPGLWVWAAWRQGKLSAAWLWALRCCVAATFIGHGLYALQVYPVSGSWINWTVRILGLSPTQALDFLWLMGLLDCLAAALLFWPRLAPLALWYCIAWGFLTALARIWANLHLEALGLSLHQWLWEMVYRFLHGGGPLLLYWLNHGPRR